MSDKNSGDKKDLPTPLHVGLTQALTSKGRIKDGEGLLAEAVIDKVRLKEEKNPFQTSYGQLQRLLVTLSKADNQEQELIYRVIEIFKVNPQKALALLNILIASNVGKWDETRLRTEMQQVIENENNEYYL
jgi:hypothetical protein